MISIASIQSDVLTSISIAVGTTAISSVILGFDWLRDQRRNRDLSTAAVDQHAMAQAAVAAESEDAEVIRDILVNAVAEVAAGQGLEPGLVRGAVFALDDSGSLRIMPNQTVAFTSSDEAEICIQVGESGAGEAARSGKPVIALFESPLSDSTIADHEQRSRIDSSLRWIIALPVIGAPGQGLWVLTVDGLVEPRTQEALRPSVAQLLYYREALELVLRARSKPRKPVISNVRRHNPNSHRGIRAERG